MHTFSNQLAGKSLHMHTTLNGHLQNHFLQPKHVYGVKIKATWRETAQRYYMRKKPSNIYCINHEC